MVTCILWSIPFHKGDIGDSVYIIAAGRVRAHDGELVFNELGLGDVVGEMAVLDAEPRSASVSAVEPTELLCLHQAPLYNLIGSLSHGHPKDSAP